MQIELKKLNKKIRTIWLLWGFLGTIIITIPFIILCALCAKNNILLPLLLSLGLVYVFLLFIFICYPMLRYNCYSYGYDEKRIIIKKGVIFKRYIIIPICQIQDLHLVQGPLMLMFKISTIVISTAGSDHIIKGLDSELAKKMVEEFESDLLKRIEALKDE